MSKPRILVLAATGRTDMPVALQLLEEGFPLTTFVHHTDPRSERLKAKDAEIVVGSLTDPADLRIAMAGARRAYFCMPNEAGYLKAAVIFTVLAAEQQLESVVAMSQWPTASRSMNSWRKPPKALSLQCTVQYMLYTQRAVSQPPSHPPCGKSGP